MRLRRLLALLIAILSSTPLLLAVVPTGYVQVSGSHLTDSTGNPVANATISFAPVNNAGTAISFRIGQGYGGAVHVALSGGGIGSCVVDSGGSGYTNVPTLIVSTTYGSGGTLLASVSGGAITGCAVGAAGSYSSTPSVSVSGYGQSVQSAVTAQVTNGTFSLQVADTALTSPLNVCFAVTVIDNVSGNSILGPGYNCVQPAGSGTAVTGSTAWCAASGTAYGGSCNFDAYTPNLAALAVTVVGPTGPAGPTGPMGPSGTATVAGTAGYPVGLNLSSVATTFDPTTGSGYVAPLTAVTVPTVDTNWDSFTGMTGMVNHGDSITYGTGSSGGTGTAPYLSTAYAGILAAHSGFTASTLGGTWRNYGVPTDMACDQARSVFTNDAPGTADTNYWTWMTGLNEADYMGSGAYEAVDHMCAMAAFTYLALPSNQKKNGSTTTPATNWSTDTTYAAMTGLASSTNAAAQTWNFTTSLSNSPEVFLWYRCFDQGAGAAWSSGTTYTAGQIVSYLNVSYIALIGSTAVTPTPGTTWASTAGSFSTSFGSGTSRQINTSTPFPMNTANGATDSVCYADLGVFGGAAGAHSVTATVTSPTGYYVSILGVGYGPESTTPPQVFVAGVSRNLGDVSGVDTAEYNRMRENEVKSLQLLNIFNIHWINVRSYWNNNFTDMSSALIGQHHPNNLGETEIANAFLGKAPFPASRTPLSADPTSGLIRTITSGTFATGCFLSPTDDAVYFSTATASTCQLPDEVHTPLPKRIWLQNLASGVVTLTGGPSQSGNAVGLQLTRYQGVIIETMSIGQWNIMGRGVLDLTSHTCTISPTMPYTLLSTDDCVFINASGVVTIPTTFVGKQYELFNGSTGDVTFSGGGTVSTQVLHPGQGILFYAATSSNYKAVGNTNQGGYKNVTTLAGVSYTLLPQDEYIDDPNTGATTITLSTTGVAGRIIPIANRGTNTLAFTGNSSGNANSVTIASGGFGWLVSGASGRWDVFVSGGGGGGSGTVNSGTANQIAYYAGTGTTVSGNPRLTDNGNALVYSGGATYNAAQVGNGTQAFSVLPTCASGLNGMTAPISDSTTTIVGATITGGGSGKVDAYCNGTNWVVGEGGSSTGAVSGVSNADGTLTISPTTGAVVGSLNLGHANTWTATQLFPAASIPNVTLANASTTVNSQTCTLGASCTIPLSAINPQTATYTALAADFANYKTITVASGTFTITLVASGSQPANGQFINVVNYGTGAVTVARSGQNINGGTASIVLGAGTATAPTSTQIWSDGTNYFATVDQATVGTVTGVTGTAPIASSGGAAPAISCATCTTAASALAANAFLFGAGGQAMTGVALTGYIKGNGASAATASTTIPLTDLAAQIADSWLANATGSSAAPTAVSIPNCANGLTYSTSTHTFGCAAGGAVSSVSNADGTLTISPTTGAVVGSLNLGHANTWTGNQTFPAGSIGATQLANFAPTVNNFTKYLSAADAANIAVNGLNIIGDSNHVTTAFGLQGTNVYGFGTQICIDYSVPTSYCVNKATQSDNAADMAFRAFSNFAMNDTQNPIGITICCTNEADQTAEDTANQYIGMRQNVEGLLSYMTLGTSERSMSFASATSLVTFATDSTTFTASKGVSTATTGSFLQNVYVGVCGCLDLWQYEYSSGGGSFQVIDNPTGNNITLTDTITGNSTLLATGISRAPNNIGTTWAAGAHFINLTPSVYHQIKINVTVSGKVGIIGMGSPANKNRGANKAVQIFGNTGHLQYSANESFVVNTNTNLNLVLADMWADGNHVIPADVYDAIDPLLDFDSKAILGYTINTVGGSQTNGSYTGSVSGSTCTGGTPQFKYTIAGNVLTSISPTVTIGTSTTYAQNCTVAGTATIAAGGTPATVTPVLSTNTSYNNQPPFHYSLKGHQDLLGAIESAIQGVPLPSTSGICASGTQTLSHQCHVINCFGACTISMPSSTSSTTIAQLGLIPGETWYLTQSSSASTSLMTVSGTGTSGNVGSFQPGPYSGMIINLDDTSGIYLVTGFYGTNTANKCTSTASPAVCGSAIQGVDQVAAAATTLQINTSQVRAASYFTFNYTTAASGCTTAPANMSSLGAPYVSSITAGTSFTITLPVAPTTNPACVMWSMY